MIGTNHTIEPGFMNNLPIPLRGVAMDLLKFYRLKQLIVMLKTQPPQNLKSRFTLTEQQWKVVLSAVILTKISYFNITERHSIPNMAKLFEIVKYILNTKEASIIGLDQPLEKEYPFFDRWFKNLHKTILIKHKKTQQT